MAKVLLSRAFEAQKNQFLARHGENPRLDSGIKEILRQLDEAEIPSDNELGAARIPIAIGVGRKVDLCCSYFIHPHSGEVAPYSLFLPEEILKKKKSINDTEIPDALRAVLEELGWIEPPQSQPLISIPSSGTPT